MIPCHHNWVAPVPLKVGQVLMLSSEAQFLGESIVRQSLFGLQAREIPSGQSPHTHAHRLRRYIPGGISTFLFVKCHLFRCSSPATRRRPFKQLGGFHDERARQAIHDVDTCVVDAPLQRTDVGAINTGAVRQLLLRHAFGLPEGFQVKREHLSYFHARESNLLSSIPPRSILDRQLSREIGVVRRNRGQQDGGRRAGAVARP